MPTSPTALILKALDGLSLRQAAIAQNIANAGSANYRPVRVKFEAALAAAAAGDARAVEQLTPTMQPAAEPGVRLDQELATAASTAMRYAALIEVLDRRLQLQSLITGSR